MDWKQWAREVPPYLLKRYKNVRRVGVQSETLRYEVCTLAHDL